MKKRMRQKGFTLIEVLLSIAIFAAIALPLMSVFLQSAKTDNAARDVLNANYIAQDYIETLNTKTYYEALGSVPTLEAHGGYYLTATLQPYGNAKSMFSSSCVYTHLIMRSNGSVLAVLPDGKWRLFSTLPSSISLSVSSGKYTLNCSGVTVTGSAAYNNCALIVNAMKKTAGGSTSITLGASCQAIVYCTSGNKSTITVAGTSQYHSDIIAADTSLIKVTAKVYDSANKTTPMSTTEAYLNIKNE